MSCRNWKTSGHGIFSGYPSTVGQPDLFHVNKGEVNSEHSRCSQVAVYGRYGTENTEQSATSHGCIERASELEQEHQG
jgi:hypothetical protein